MVGATDATAARWPGVPAGRGHYESWYLRALDPKAPRGVWIRYTVTGATRRRADRSALVHVVRPLGAGAAGGPRRCRASGQRWRLLDPVREHSFGPEGALGAATSADCSARWSLHFSGGEEPLRHLTKPWMYTARLPRTKLMSPVPDAVFDGSLEVDGETIRVDGWPGMVGHNWGEQHAEEWIWLSGLAFEGASSGTWLDVACGRIRIGPVTTPWVANGVVCLDGERLRVGGLGRRPGVTADEDGCVLRLPGRESSSRRRPRRRTRRSSTGTTPIRTGRRTGCATARSPTSPCAWCVPAATRSTSWHPVGPPTSGAADRNRSAPPARSSSGPARRPGPRGVAVAARRSGRRGRRRCGKRVP